MPSIFEKAREALADHIDHFGYFPERSGYYEAARGADVVVSTAVQEFFGVSVIEAIYLGCLPVLPRRLSYPEIIPAHLHPFFLYRDDQQLPEFLADFLRRPPLEYQKELQRHMNGFHWKHLAPQLDQMIEEIV
jgi:glycosyltransferase involved in cell wall biosynthesis